MTSIGSMLIVPHPLSIQLEVKPLVSSKPTKALLNTEFPSASVPKRTCNLCVATIYTVSLRYQTIWSQLLNWVDYKDLLEAVWWSQVEWPISIINRTCWLCGLATREWRLRRLVSSARLWLASFPNTAESSGKWRRRAINEQEGARE